jgi:hypothetical protein
VERQYNEQDLLTRTTMINPNWQEGDPEDEQYIVVYEDEGYTGFLPVNLKINPPNFVQQWGIEDSEGQISIESLPIDQSGVYKFLYHGGEMGPFALGYIPIRRYDSSTEDFDFSINIPEKLIELEPNQVITISHNKRKKTFTVYDDEADSDMDFEETDDQPLPQPVQQQRTLLKLRDSNSNSNSNDTSYRNIGDFTIDVNIPIYDGYDQSNPLTINQNGSGVISIPQNYEGLGEINYEINVPQTAVNNYTQSTITTNGTYTIPNGYTGFNDFTVNVNNQKSISINDFYYKYGNQSSYTNNIPNPPTGSYSQFSFEYINSNKEWVKDYDYIVLGMNNNRFIIGQYQSSETKTNNNYYGLYRALVNTTYNQYVWVYYKYNGSYKLLGFWRDSRMEGYSDINFVYYDDLILI